MGEFGDDEEQQQVQQQQQEPLIENPGVDAKIENAAKFLSRHDIPTLNFSIALILVLTIPFLAQLFNDPYETVFGFGGSLLFLMILIFSVLGVYGSNKQQAWAFTIYRNAMVIFAVGFSAVFIVSLVTLIRGKYDQFLTKTTTVIFMILSLPYAGFLAASFLFARKQLKQIRSQQ